jgi:hypothetical protein
VTEKHTPAGDAAVVLFSAALSTLHIWQGGA